MTFGRLSIYCGLHNFSYNFFKYSNHIAQPARFLVTRHINVSYTKKKDFRPQFKVFPYPDQSPYLYYNYNRNLKSEMDIEVKTENEPSLKDEMVDVDTSNLNEKCDTRKRKLSDLPQRTVSVQCGAWRKEEEDGGDILIFKNLPSPAPSITDYTERIEDVWIEGEPNKVLLLDDQVGDKDSSGKTLLLSCEKRKADDGEANKDLKKAKLETKALKAKRPGFTDDRYNETSYYIENGLRKVYPYYFTFTTFTKGRWVGERILDVFAREFRAHPAAEYERCVRAGTLTVNYDRVPPDYRLRHNDLLANIVHRHEVPVTCQPITVVHMDEDIVVVNKPASIPVHPCGRYRHNTVVFILAKEYNLKNLRTIHRLDRLTSGLLLFGRSPKKARQMEHQIRNRQVSKEYVCRVEGEFPDEEIECREPIEVVSYKIGVCRVSARGKECATTFCRLGYNGRTSVVLCRPRTGRMHQIRVHLQYLGYPVVNDPLYNHPVFGPLKGRGGDLGGKTDEELVRDLISIHNAENWLGMDGDSELSLFKPKAHLDLDKVDVGHASGGEEDCEVGSASRESSPSLESPTLPANNNATSNNSNATSENTSCPSPAKRTTSPQTSENFNNIPAPAKITSNHGRSKVTVATQTGHEAPDMSFNQEKMTVDPHCYECKVRYRDPRPSDLVMYLHAWKYRGPGWEYETELPEWASVDWIDPDSQ